MGYLGIEGVRSLRSYSLMTPGGTAGTRRAVQVDLAAAGVDPSFAGESWIGLVRVAFGPLCLDRRGIMKGNEIAPAMR